MNSSKAKSAKARTISMPKITRAEKEQVHARRELGHDFGIRVDEFGRQRLVAGTMKSKRMIDISNGGFVALGGIARVRNVDPLKGIASLTVKQREAGAKYREAFEYCAREGMKTGAMQERVDGGSMSGMVPARLMDARTALARADAAMGHWEIVGTIQDVCGRALSVRAIAEREGDRRKSIITLLKVGLDMLAVHYGMMPRQKLAAKN